MEGLRQIYPPRVEPTERLEGSQTSPRRLKLREATSGKPLCSMAALWVGSRRLPGTSRGVAVLWAGCIRTPNRRDGQNIALGHSREPPATDP
jgi:hypothetical protein